MKQLVQKIEAAVPGEDVEAYQRHCAHWTEHYHPAGEFERRLVQIIADTSWRLARVSQWSLEQLVSTRDVREISRWEERLDKHLARVRKKLDQIQQQRRHAFESAPVDPGRPPN